MLYEFHELARRAVLEPINIAGRVGSLALQPMHALAPPPLAPATGALAAGLALLDRATRSYPKQPFGLAVTEQVVWSRPFCDLLHFPADRPGAPRVLIVAPMSGHHATLLRGTVESLLGEHELFVTDWLDAKLVPVAHGRFGLDDYVQTVMELFALLAEGGPFHVLAVCQPCVPVLAATALLSEDGSPALPDTLVLMSGPLDPGANETEVTRFALKHDLSWFERTLIHLVPSRYPGRYRRVYPGMVQLAGFMSTQIERHLRQHLDLFLHWFQADHAAAERITDFYDEYLAVQDIAADFYLDTIDRVFQRRDLAQGRLEWRGRRVDPGAIERIRLVTVEGERDDICAPGQTLAAHALCRNLPDVLKVHHLQPEVGHYGVFSGSRYRQGILPLLRRSFAGG